MCIVNISVLNNRITTDLFSIRCGVRQGDPLPHVDLHKPVPGSQFAGSCEIAVAREKVKQKWGSTRPSALSFSSTPCVLSFLHYKLRTWNKLDFRKRSIQFLKEGSRLHFQLLFSQITTNALANAITFSKFNVLGSSKQKSLLLIS